MMPPRMPNGLFAQEFVPRLPKHSGDAQDGRTFQFGDPGAAIGELKSVTSTFGEASQEHEECTFLGTDGFARATRMGMQVLRFADAPICMVRPLCTLVEDPARSPFTWSWYDAQYRPLFERVDTGYGHQMCYAMERLHAAYLLRGAPQKLAAEGVRFWAGESCFVHLVRDVVEVQQLGRHDIAPAKDVTLLMMEDIGFELVLQAPQFYEARFLTGEFTNRMLLKLYLTMMGAQIER